MCRLLHHQIQASPHRPAHTHRRPALAAHTIQTPKETHCEPSRPSTAPGALGSAWGPKQALKALRGAPEEAEPSIRVSSRKCLSSNQRQASVFSLHLHGNAREDLTARKDITPPRASSNLIKWQHGPRLASLRCPATRQAPQISQKAPL